MPFDDDAEADNPGFRPPPHPDDRLWRHPSEMDAHPIVPIGAPVGRLSMDPTTAHGGQQGRRPWGAVVVAGSVGALLAGVGVTALGLGERVVERPVTERVALDPSTAVLGNPDALTVDQVRERVSPAVVGIVAAGAAADRPEVAGSGLVVRDDGVVVTSAALATAGAEPRVRLPDGNVVAAELLGADPATGLAVLDLTDDGDHPTGVLADASGLAAGETAYTFNARETDGSAMAAGAVGPASRYVGPTGAALDGVEVEGRADALAVGGPVVDQRGAVVGIVTGVDAGSSWYVAPVEVARRVVDALLADGVVHHPWLGIEGTDAAATAADGPATLADQDAGTAAPDDDGGSEGTATDPGADDADQAAAEAGQGTRVASVVPDSPAAVGGLRTGDVIVALDGQPVAGMPDLMVALRSRAPGDRVDVTVTRDDGSRTTLVLTLAETPAPTP